MNRRTFIQLGSGAMGLALLAACDRLPPLPSKIPRIAYFTYERVSLDAPRQAAFEQGLADLGLINGQTIVVDWVYVDDQPDVPLTTRAQELVSRAPQVIVVSYTPTLVATAQATRTIPIVSVLPHRDLRALGLIQSEGHPGGNVTGLGGNPDIAYGKLVELLKDMVPSITRLAYLHNPSTPGSAGKMEVSQTAAGQLGLEFIELQAANPPEMEAAFASAASVGANGLVVESDAAFSINTPIMDLSLRYGLPTIYSQIEGYVDYGGLMAYSPDVVATHRRAANYVDKILKGVSPAELPVEEATIFNFAINSTTATTLGLAIPTDVMLQATQIFQ